MATSVLGNRSRTIQSLLVVGSLLMLAGIGGFVAALTLKKPPPLPSHSLDAGPNADDPSIRLWAAEALFGANSAPPGQDLVESVVKAGTAKGITMVSLPWDSARDAVKERGPSPILLTHQSLPPVILLDVFSWEGETQFLLISPNGQAIVLTESDFHAAPWQHAVWVQGGPVAAREVAIGRAKVSVDRAWHSFGAVNPYSVVKTEFQLTNPSDLPVRIERIGTSCGCATVAEITTRTLLPRSSLKLPVSLHTDSQRAIAQQVWIILSAGSENGVQVTVPVTMHVYAWQPQAMEVSPSRIDFGPISRARIAESVIRLTESPVDRFQLQASDFAGLPIRESVERRKQEGLSTYLMRLRLDPSCLRASIRRQSTFTLPAGSGRSSQFRSISPSLPRSKRGRRLSNSRLPQRRRTSGRLR